MNHGGHRCGILFRVSFTPRLCGRWSMLNIICRCSDVCRIPESCTPAAAAAPTAPAVTGARCGGAARVSSGSLILQYVRWVVRKRCSPGIQPRGVSRSAAPPIWICNPNTSGGGGSWTTGFCVLNSASIAYPRSFVVHSCSWVPCRACTGRQTSRLTHTITAPR